MAFALPLLPALGLAGAGISAVGAVEQGAATSNMANYNAAVATNNATIANQNADYATTAGIAKAAATSLKGAAIGGRIKASQAANNIDVNTGSAKSVQVGQREISNLDTETVVNNAALENYGYRSQATGFEATAGLDEGEAAQAPIGADLSAGGSLLSNASSLGLKWQGAQAGQPLSLNAADYT